MLADWPEITARAADSASTASVLPRLRRVAWSGWLTSITVTEVRLGSVGRIRRVFATIQMAEAYDIHTRVLGSFPAARDSYGTDVRKGLHLASTVDFPAYLNARFEAVQIRSMFTDVFADVDVLLTPVSAAGPATIAAPNRVAHLGAEIKFRDLVMNFTTVQDLTGLPACSVATGLDDGGMPVGVQLTAAPQREDLVLRTAAAIQAALPLPSPPLNGAPHF